MYDVITREDSRALPRGLVRRTRLSRAARAREAAGDRRRVQGWAVMVLPGLVSSGASKSDASRSSGSGARLSNLKPSS
eukprot:6556891-Pyramimonas_sp.AAC.1